MKGPGPGASLRGFMAVALDMARVDPDRRPSAEMGRWHRDIAAQVGVAPITARTSRELLEAAMRLQEILAERGEAAPVPTPSPRASGRQAA